MQWRCRLCHKKLCLTPCTVLAAALAEAYNHPMNTHPTAAAIIIGNELLSGRTQDANLNYIANGVNRHGLKLMEARVIPDVEQTIIDTVRTLSKAHDVVFTTGGIGPTHDDITAHSIAKAFNVPIIRHRAALAAIEDHYADNPTKCNESRRKMADVPEGCELIGNPVSGAPGFRMENVYVMAGVPRIMQAMFDRILPGLPHGSRILSMTLRINIPEGDVADGLRALQEDNPDVEIGSYPFNEEGVWGTNLVLRHPDSAHLESIMQLLEALCAKAGAAMERLPMEGV